jgi:hypothetical protein
MINRNRFSWSGFPIAVHSWGGLGSQLHALFLCSRIQKDFPGRKVILVFHSSGVTRRPPEILSILGEISYRVIDDFVESGTGKKSNARFRIKLKKFLSTRLHLLEECNNDFEYLRLRLWTLQTRGHYSRLSLNREFSTEILTRISSSGELGTLGAKDFSHSSSIHMRLGDLLEIEEKNPTKFGDVKNVFISNWPIFQGFPLFVYSDSPEKAIELLSEIKFAVLADDFLQKSALRTILAMAESSIFVGTASKLSIWVAVLRIHAYPTRRTFLPSYLRPILESLIPNLNESSTVVFYQSEEVMGH